MCRLSDYRNLERAKKMRKKRRSAMNKRRSFSLGRLNLAKSSSLDQRDTLISINTATNSNTNLPNHAKTEKRETPKSCPAVHISDDHHITKFGFDLSAIGTAKIDKIEEVSPSPPISGSKHKRRIQWMDEQKQKKAKKSSHKTYVSDIYS